MDTKQIDVLRYLHRVSQVGGVDYVHNPVWVNQIGIDERIVDVRLSGDWTGGTFSASVVTEFGNLYPLNELSECTLDTYLLNLV